jgi:hypothetical protein
MQADRHLGVCYKCREVYPCGAYTSLHSIGARGRQLRSLAIFTAAGLSTPLAAAVERFRPLVACSRADAYEDCGVKGGRETIEPARIVGFRPDNDPRWCLPVVRRVDGSGTQW